MKVLIVKKKSLITGVLAVCFAILFIVAMVNLVPSAVQAAAQSRKLPIYCVDKSEKVVSLSFDAAWGNEDTQTLIDILNRYKVHATFFVVGMWVDKYPESVKALADNGNEVMNHSNTHPHMTKLSTDEMLKEITACDDKIQKVTGVRPILFRPPFGDYNNTLVEALEASKHYCIQWDVDSLDWRSIPASQITKNVLKKVKPGSIILFHNAAKHTPEALPGIIDSLQRQGYKIVPISQLIYKDNYTIDVAGKQHSNAASTAWKSSNITPVQPELEPE
jgi:peptidoglycan-N-acetylglucosamine deacetylase